MRKSSKTFSTPEHSRVQGYHEGGSYGGEDYAFNGFSERLYFTSDRTIKLDEHFNRADGKANKAYGLEIETECNGVNSSDAYAETLEKLIFPSCGFPAHLFKLQRDGSLGGNSSAECITQLMTKEFVRNNYGAFKTFYDYYLPVFNASAGSSHCGMHVNMSNALFGASKASQDVAIRKLYYIVNKHFNLMCQMFKRLGSTSYCGRMDYTTAKTMDLSAFGSNHYVCFNLGHYNAGRIELRIVGGQKNFASFRNTMETVFFLVDRVKSISWADCDNPAAIFAGCNGYVLSRCIDAYDAGTLTPDAFNEITDKSTRERDYI